MAIEKKSVKSPFREVKAAYWVNISGKYVQYMYWGEYVLYALSSHA